MFSGFSDPFTVFHWHGDTFDLPDGASRLASSKFYPNQAFQYRSAVGVQFHLEVDIDMVNFWVDNMQKRNLMNSTSAEKIKEDAKKYTQTVCRNMDMFYNNFKFLFNL